jgi:DNA-directed RNA polymerase subunit RPC12/RpoP
VKRSARYRAPDGHLVSTNSVQGTLPVFMHVVCPACGHRCRVPESLMGKQAICPACTTTFRCGSLAPPSLQTEPVPADQPPGVQPLPQARAAQAASDPRIHYRCPRCVKPLESPVAMAGQKLNCPDCGQRIQVPQPTAAPAAPSPAAPGLDESIPEVLPVVEPAPRQSSRRETCLECGVDVSQRPRIQTCPDCGSLFCSARCFREHRYHAHPSRR